MTRPSRWPLLDDTLSTPEADVGKHFVTGLDELSHLLLLVPLNWHARVFMSREWPLVLNLSSPLRMG